MAFAILFFEKVYCSNSSLLLEVSVQQALQSLAVSGFVSGHLVDGVIE